MKVLMRMMVFCLLFALLSFHCLAQSGIITTYVNLGSPRNGSPATAQSIDSPYSIALDGVGGFYFTSGRQNRIYHMAADGRIRLAAGSGMRGYGGDGGPATSAQLTFPMHLAVDAAGNLYIADGGNNRIRKVTPAGVIATIAGNGEKGPGSGRDTSIGDGGVATSAQLNNPLGFAIDSAGNLYVADAGNYRVRKVTPAGNITTVAGNGESGRVAFREASNIGDGGQATAAKLDRPLDVAIDSAGNIYIATPWRVRKVTPDGVITTFAGVGEFEPYSDMPMYHPYHYDGGKATSAEIAADALAVDSSGNLYIADHYHNRVLKVTPDGVITSVAGNDKRGFNGDGGPAASSQLSNPRDVTVDSAGNVYIADSENNRIRKIARDGVITTAAGKGDQPAKPEGIALDSAGNLYIADSANNRVLKVTPDGTITTAAGNGQINWSIDGIQATSAPLFEPNSVAVDASGALYFTEGRSPEGLGGRIRKVSSAGVITSIALKGQEFPMESGPTPPGMMILLLNTPTGIAIDSAGILYIAGLNGVQKVAHDGTVTTIARSSVPLGLGFIMGFGGAGGRAAPAPLFSPTGIAVDSKGNLYIADKGAHRIQIIAPDGVISAFAGNGMKGYSGDGGKATSAQLSEPTSVAIDSVGNLYIADFGNKRVRKVAPDGVITTIAGNGNPGHSGDGGPATSAQLSSPVAVAMDATDNLYIADYTDGCIRKVILSAR
jgi:sugar lactone lactonase YvrE